MLVLPIKKKWFDMIRNGEKKEEYRDITTYWTKRFKKYLRDKERKPFEILLRNGYGKDKPTLKCLVSIGIDYGLPKWGGYLGETYYVLKILRVEDYLESKGE